MSKNEERSEPNWKDRIAVKYTEIKNHVRKNKTTYAVGAAGFVLTTVTFVVTKRVYSMNGMLAKKIVIKDSVLLIRTFERSKGPPSWVIRCMENGRVYHSQEHAARAMKLSKEQLSSYFNGGRSNVGGYHFERVAIGLPKSG